MKISVLVLKLEGILIFRMLMMLLLLILIKILKSKLMINPRKEGKLTIFDFIHLKFY